MLSLYIFNADRVPPELQVVDPMDIDPPYGMDFQLESLGAWTNMSKVSQLRMEYVRGPGVPYWEYTDIASILFGCLVLLLPLMAYVMGDDGDEDD